MSLFDDPLGAVPGVAGTRFSDALHAAAVRRGEDEDGDDGTT